MVRCLALLLCAACAPLHPAGSAADEATLALVDVHLVDVESGRVIPGQTVLISGSRIVALEPAATARIPAGARVVDGRDRYLIPGLIDTHAHAWLDEPYDSLAVLGGYLANGVTGVRFMSSTRDGAAQLRLRDAVQAGSLLAPRMFVSGTVSPRARAQSDAATLVELVSMLARQGYDGIKILYLGRDEALGVIAEARRLGLPVYGHTYHSAEDGGTEDYTMDAVRAGISGLVHVEGIAPQGPGSGDPGATPYQWRWLEADTTAMQALIDTMVAQGTWLEATLLITHFFPQPDRYRHHPATRYLPVPWEEYRTWFGDETGEALQKHDAALRAMQAFVRRFHAAGGRVLAGTDNVPVPAYGLHDEMQLLVEAGLSPAAALRTATLWAAEALGWSDRVGTIRAGRLADLVLLEANPLDDIGNTQRIAAVVTSGRYLDGAALERLREGLTPRRP